MKKKFDFTAEMKEVQVTKSTPAFDVSKFLMRGMNES